MLVRDLHVPLPLTVTSELLDPGQSCAVPCVPGKRSLVIMDALASGQVRASCARMGGFTPAGLRHRL